MTVIRYEFYKHFCVIDQCGDFMGINKCQFNRLRVTFTAASSQSEANMADRCCAVLCSL